LKKLSEVCWIKNKGCLLWIKSKIL
jgi:hypothetical protein